jgi:hypothetical protein
MRLVAQLSSVALGLMMANPVAAKLRAPFEDAQVVARSELIVVGRLKTDSVKYVAHKALSPGEGRSWEHHATLVVTEVIKGDGKPGDLPVVIHYGIDPVVGGLLQRDGHTVNTRGNRRDYPPGRIELMDTGNSAVSFAPLVEDAAEDNLWFLRRGVGERTSEVKPGVFGIIDPEDVQPLALREYFDRYRSPDPEAAIRQYVERTPDARESAKRYVDHLDVSRIAALPDVKDRVQRLAPLFLRDLRWGLEPEAEHAFVKCGTAAGDKLLEVFDRPEQPRARYRIIKVWGQLRYRRATPVLVELLDRHDKYWAVQNLKKGWWNDDKTPELGRRREVYSEVLTAVLALGAIGDPAARGAVERTRTRWKQINFENPQIVEACDDALAAFSTKDADLPGGG